MTERQPLKDRVFFQVDAQTLDRVRERTHRSVERITDDRISNPIFDLVNDYELLITDQVKDTGAQ